MDSDELTMGLANYLDAVLRQCEFCRAPDMAPRIPIAGIPTVSVFNGKLKVGALFLMIPARCATAVYPKNSLRVPARSKNPPENWDVFRS